MSIAETFLVEILRKSKITYNNDFFMVELEGGSFVPLSRLMEEVKRYDK